ncbi:MAG: hypothetical protein ABIK28_01220 [Planctomycetota bacterium]
MTFIIWLQPEECIGLKTGGGRVSLRWEGKSGLEGTLRACPKKGGNKDVIILCEDVINLPVHLPIQPGKEPEDRETLRESLRWEAEPLLGYSPAGAPFDFAAGVNQNGAVGGSDWWITSVEPGTFDTWKQACKHTGFRLRCAMDPWTAIASCLPDGNHLLIHDKRVVLAQLQSRRMITFKTWRRPTDCPPGGHEWVDGILNSLEWSCLQGEVNLWDLSGSTDMETTIERLHDKTDIEIKPATVKGEKEAPWCRLLAKNAPAFLKGRAAMPAARTVKTEASGPGVLESALYAIMVVALLAGLGYWYLLDSSALHIAENDYAAFERNLRAASSDKSASELAAMNQELTQELNHLTWLKEEATWRRRLPGELFSRLASHAVRWENTRIIEVRGSPRNDSYEIIVSGESSSHKEVLGLNSDLMEIDFGKQGSTVDLEGLSIPRDAIIGTFDVTITWPLKP